MNVQRRRFELGTLLKPASTSSIVHVLTVSNAAADVKAVRCNACCFLCKLMVARVSKNIDVSTV